MQWRIEQLGEFFDPQEDMVVYFDRRSGDTHLITAFAAHILRQFSDQPLDIDELVRRVSPDMDDCTPAELSEALSGALDELTILDIVQLA